MNIFALKMLIEPDRQLRMPLGEDIADKLHCSYGRDILRQFGDHLFKLVT